MPSGSWALSLSLLLLLTLFQTQLTTAQLSGLGSLLGWQQHSWDDLREWRASMLKGSWIFKVDFSFNPEEYCAQQEHVPQPADPRGCLLLAHSTTSLSVGAAGPWSSTDLLLFLKSSHNRPLLVAPARRKLLAINFKNSPDDPCDDSASSQDWISLFDDFYEDANALINSLGLNVEFYWDSLPYNSCLTQRWPQWASTWDAGQPYDSRPFDNNASSGNQRYQVLNRDAGSGLGNPDLVQLAREHWLKFGDSKYPLVVYEPTDEINLNLINDIFLSSQWNHTPGYVVAFNGDPLMHTLYSSSRSHKALHQPLTSDLAFNLSTQPSLSAITSAWSWPQITTLDTSITRDGSSFITLTVYEDAQRKARYITQSGTAPHPDPFPDAPPPAVVFTNYTTLMHTDLPEGGQPDDRFAAISSFYLEGKAYVVVGDVNGGVQVYSLDTQSGALQLLHSFSFPSLRQANYERRALSALPLPGLMGLGAGAVALVQASSGHYSTGDHCSVWLQLYAMDFSALGSDPQPQALGPAVCASVRVGATQVTVAAVEAGRSSRCTANEFYGRARAIEAYVTYGNQFDAYNVGVESQVRMAQVCMDTDYGGASNTVVPPLTAVPQLMTVGDFPAVAAVLDPSGNFSMIFVTATNGFCPNTYPDDDTPFGAPLTCDAYLTGRPHPTMGVLSYTYGRSDEFARQLAASSRSADASVPLASVCSDKLLHGIYDQGYQPSASIIHTPAGFLVNSVHAGLQGMAQNMCGGPVPADGLVLDAFLLSTPARYVPASGRVGLRTATAALRRHAGRKAARRSEL